MTIHHIDGLVIDSTAIEAILRLYPGVREAAVVGIDGTPGTFRLVAYIVPGQSAPSIHDLEALPARRRYTLPNGMIIAHQTRVEADHFYEDIFEKQIYARHGITFNDGDCVFDVGANIGMFTLFVHHRVRAARIYAFEPAPPVFETLSMNTAAHGVNVKLFNCGVADEHKTAQFTFYPNSTGMSSFYADKQEEQAILRAIMSHHLEEQVDGIDEVMQYADELLEARFKAMPYTCTLRPLKDVIAEQQVERIDLLKVDVQKAELDVLLGVGEENWSKIRQVVMEVHDIDHRLQQITELLERHGFSVVVEQDDLHTGTILYNLFAWRTAEQPQPADRRPAQQTVEQSSRSFPADDLRRFLHERLPDHMVPTTFVLLETLPRTAEGSVDQAQLAALAPESGKIQPAVVAEQRPHSVLEQGQQRAEARRHSAQRQKDLRQRSRTTQLPADDDE